MTTEGKSSQFNSKTFKRVVGILILPLLMASFIIGRQSSVMTQANPQANSKSPVAMPAPPVVETNSAGQVTSYADVVARVQPAVVTITSSKKATISQQPLGFDDDLLRRFFGDRFRGQEGPSVPQRGLGSGVIVSPDGYILTNNHVVDDADSITVLLNDRRTVEAKVVGTDPLSDLAVIKIEEKNLPVISVGDSDKARVGDVALAIGNPLNVGQTVTMGIISAKGRHTQLGNGDFEDFIQTDAPINRGNSGGALINTKGELIGINSQILSPSGGSIGIGFAIPTNMARGVMDQLIKTGTVRRGLLGVTTRDVDSKIATSLSIPQVRGALVTETQPGSAAERTGLKPYDVIVGVNDSSVEDSNSLKNQIATIQPGSNVVLTVIRNGKEQKLSATLGERKSEIASATGRATLPGDPSSGTSKLQGVKLEEMRPDIASQLNMARNTQGVVVTDIDPSSSAAQSGLAERDVITEINRTPVRSIGDLNAAVNASGNRPLLLMVKRPTPEGSQSLILTLDARS